MAPRKGTDKQTQNRTEQNRTEQNRTEQNRKHEDTRLWAAPPPGTSFSRVKASDRHGLLFSRQREREREREREEQTTGDCTPFRGNLRLFCVSYQ